MWESERSPVLRVSPCQISVELITMLFFPRGIEKEREREKDTQLSIFQEYFLAQMSESKNFSQAVSGYDL